MCVYICTQQDWAVHTVHVSDKGTVLSTLICSLYTDHVPVSRTYLAHSHCQLDQSHIYWDTRSVFNFCLKFIITHYSLWSENLSLNCTQLNTWIQRPRPISSFSEALNLSLIISAIWLGLWGWHALTYTFILQITYACMRKTEEGGKEKRKKEGDVWVFKMLLLLL